MAYLGEPQSNGAPTPPTRDSWWPIVIALGVVAAFAYWFFSV
jgi:hypothetical protein